MLDSLVKKETLHRLRMHPQNLEQKMLKQIACVADTHVNQALDLIEYTEAEIKPLQIIDPQLDDLPDVTDTEVVSAWIGWNYSKQPATWNLLMVHFLQLMWAEGRFSSVAEVRAVFPAITIVTGKPPTPHYKYIREMDASVNITGAKLIFRNIVQVCQTLGWGLDLVLKAKGKKCKTVPVGGKFRIALSSFVKKLRLVSK